MTTEPEPCCRPEYCPKQPEFKGDVIGWGGNPDAEHTCCLCADYSEAVAVPPLHPFGVCRPEPHCVCGDNAWYHGDGEDDSKDSKRCYQQDCTCKKFLRCRAFTSSAPHTCT